MVVEEEEEEEVVVVVEEDDDTHGGGGSHRQTDRQPHDTDGFTNRNVYQNDRKTRPPPAKAAKRLQPCDDHMPL